MSQSIAAPATIGGARTNAIVAALPLIGRIMIAAIFLMSGAGKIAQPAMMVGYIRSVGLPLAEVGLGLAILIEVGGGIALIAGYRTRLVAALMALFTIAAAVAFHADFADQNQLVHFFKNIAIVGGLLQIVAFGAGAFSLDNRR